MRARRNTPRSRGRWRSRRASSWVEAGELDAALHARRRRSVSASASTRSVSILRQRQETVGDLRRAARSSSRAACVAVDVDQLAPRMRGAPRRARGGRHPAQSHSSTVQGLDAHGLRERRGFLAAIEHDDVDGPATQLVCGGQAHGPPSHHQHLGVHRSTLATPLRHAPPAATGSGSGCRPPEPDAGWGVNTGTGAPLVAAAPPWLCAGGGNGR